MNVTTLCRVMLVPLGPGKSVSILTLHIFSTPLIHAIDQLLISPYGCQSDKDNCQLGLLS